MNFPTYQLFIVVICLIGMSMCRMNPANELSKMIKKKIDAAENTYCPSGEEACINRLKVCLPVGGREKFMKMRLTSRECVKELNTSPTTMEEFKSLMRQGFSEAMNSFDSQPGDVQAVILCVLERFGVLNAEGTNFDSAAQKQKFKDDIQKAKDPEVAAVMAAAIDQCGDVSFNTMITFHACVMENCIAAGQ